MTSHLSFIIKRTNRLMTTLESFAELNRDDQGYLIILRIRENQCGKLPMDGVIRVNDT